MKHPSSSSSSSSSHSPPPMTPTPSRPPPLSRARSSDEANGDHHHPPRLPESSSSSSSAPQPFLTYPSGKYTAFLLRVPTAPGACGFGNNFCYIQIQDTETSQAMWESECTPISTSNGCSLVFDDMGLAIFDGSTLEWDTGAQSADNNPLQRVEMADEGDMRIRDKIGELAWRASDDPRVNQRCGQLGSPGLGPVLPPFAHPIGGRRSMPFGQEQEQGQGSGSGARQTFGFDGEQQQQQQAIGGGGGFESGSKRGVIGSWVGVAGGFVVCWFGFGFGF